MSVTDTGHATIRKLAMDCLNATRRDPAAARRLLKQRIVEDDAMLEFLAGPALDVAIRWAVTNDIRVERRDVVEAARRSPSVPTSVLVGGAGSDPRPARTNAIFSPSPEAVARRQARMLHYTGWLAFPLPQTNVLLGDAKAWEVQNACRFYLDRRKAEGKRARLFAEVWKALPDRNEPESKQQPVARYLDAPALKKLDELAQIAEESVVMELSK